MTDGPLLWYLNRSTGVVLLVLLTASVVLGVLAMGGRPGRGVPRFATQAFHRNLALLSVLMLLAHVATAVVDTYVDIRWWQALVPWWGATYQPFWLGLGTLALDVVVAVVATSLLRARLGHGSWRAVHLLAWGAWGLSLAHALGIGTDLARPSGLAVLPVALCAGAVGVALALRVARALAGSRTGAAQGAA